MPFKKRDSVCSRQSTNKSFREKMAKARADKSKASATVPSAESLDLHSTSSPSHVSPPPIPSSTPTSSAAAPSKRKLGSCLQRMLSMERRRHSLAPSCIWSSSKALWQMWFVATVGLGVSRSATPRPFRSRVQVVHHHAKETTQEVTRKARTIVAEMYEPDADGVIDAAVSFDGTWYKRGHTSNHGAAVVICALTGLVLDSHVMSLYCPVCKAKGNITDPEQRRIRWETHKDVCHINYSGSSGGMEPEAARVLWGRSLRYKMRYTTVIGDGDSKTFNALKTLDPYEGPTQKAECVNHVAKS